MSQHQGETKRRVFQIPCEMLLTRLKTYCARITQKKETSENEDKVWEFGATVEQKGNGVRAQSGGFLQTPTHSTLQCANIRLFRPPPPLKFLAQH